MNKYEDLELLKNFLEEFFDYEELKKAGFYKDVGKKDYVKQAERICLFFGFETVYEYRKEEIRAHLSFAGERPKGYEQFVTVFPSIYD